MRRFFCSTEGSLRTSAVLLSVASALFLSGCVEENYVVSYDELDISFEGSFNKFRVLHWCLGPDGKNRRPLIVHLPNGDLSEKDFASPKRMQELGGELREYKELPGFSYIDLWYDDDVKIETSYKNGVLDYVMVSAGSGRVRITLGEVTITLPINKGGLRRKLGEPETIGIGG